MATAVSPDTVMATSITTTTVTTRATPVLAGSPVSMPRPCMANRLANTPIMKTSEWAKLISRRTP